MPTVLEPPQRQTLSRLWRRRVKVLTFVYGSGFREEAASDPHYAEDQLCPSLWLMTQYPQVS